MLGEKCDGGWYLKCRVLKIMLGEKCDASNQAAGMGWWSLGWGLGSIMGPAVGGFLSNPCDQWEAFPLCSHGQLFDEK